MKHIEFTIYIETMMNHCRKSMHSLLTCTIHDITVSLFPFTICSPWSGPLIASRWSYNCIGPKNLQQFFIRPLSHFVLSRLQIPS
jgi:hypothetical protein